MGEYHPGGLADTGNHGNPVIPSPLLFDIPIRTHRLVTLDEFQNGRREVR